MMSNIAFATDLIERVLSVSDDFDHLRDLRRAMRTNGVARAVKHHDSAKLIEWLVETVSYQGISDAMASRYMAEHGRVSASQVQAAIDRGPACSHLHSFNQFPGCGYMKAARTCAEPDLVDACPLPRHDLRNGRLNQIAYALTLFVRDVCDGDLVAWIDRRLAWADDPAADDPALLMRGALLEPLARVPGLSYKVLSMSLADLLLGAGRKRGRWIEAGAGMVAVDTLVHNWLARTGILRRFDAEHAYGPLCYSSGRCSALITAFAETVDATRLCPDGPAFPRVIQHALWRFCAYSGFGLCNGNRIDDRFACPQWHCPAGETCGRVPLQPVRYRAATRTMTSPAEIV